MTRYFGGILLGTGGLVKVYTQATIEALNKANIVKKDLGEIVKFVVGYSDLEKLKYFLKQNSVRISNVQYGENVEVFVDITDEKLKEILVRRNELNFEIIYYEVIGEKFIVVD